MMAKKTKVTALIDGDTVIYEAGRSAEEIIQWNEEIITWYANLPRAEDRFVGLITEIAESMNADRIVIALSDYEQPNWRLDILPTYKQQRTETAVKRRPLAWAHLRNFCRDRFETFIRPTLEGDDVLGILMTHPTLIKGEKVCVSIDKDMKTIPGLHSNFTRNGNDFGWEVHEVTREDAHAFHMLQTLTGDKTDGYSGCPGVGEVTATRLLDGKAMDDLWPTVVQQYEKKGLTEADALVQAQVARICQFTNYDFKEKKVIPWMPS
jgi:DNA polymerase-1